MFRPRAIKQAGIPRAAYRSRREPVAGPHLGMVVATYAADVSAVQGATNPPQILCDVMMVRGGILRAQVMQRGSSVSNVDRWVPAPARTNMATGAAVKLAEIKLRQEQAHLNAALEEKKTDKGFEMLEVTQAGQAEIGVQG